MKEEGKKKTQQNQTQNPTKINPQKTSDALNIAAPPPPKYLIFES